MKKLLLTSSAKKTIHFLTKLTNKNWSDLNVIFITTAGNLYEDTWWIQDSRKALIDLGANITELDIAGKSSKELIKQIGEPDVIFVAGGNTIYLLEEVQKSGFMNIVIELIEKGVIYVGSSAGSVLAGPDLILETNFEDRKNVSKLNSYAGLSLVNFFILPHWNEKSWKNTYLKIADKLVESKISLITLTDDQAILIDGEKMKILSN